MKRRTRRNTGVAAVSLATVTLLPFSAAAATGDVDVSISNHSGQDVVSGPNVSIETSFTSMSDHPVARVEFLVDGRVATSQRLEQPVRKGRFIFAWDTRSLSNDIHTIEARAFDDQGKTGETKLQLFVDNQAIDQAAPRLRVTVPREDAVVSGQFSVQVQADQGPTVEPLWLLSIKLDDDLIWGGNLDGHSLVNFLYDGATLSDGPHYIQAAGETRDGRRILSPPIIVIVDKSHGQTQFQPGAPDIDPPGLSNPQPGPGAPTRSPFNPAPADGLSPQVLAQAQGAGLGNAGGAPVLDNSAAVQPALPPAAGVSHPTPSAHPLHPQAHSQIRQHPGMTMAENGVKPAISTFTAPKHSGTRTGQATASPSNTPRSTTPQPATPPIRIALVPSANRPVVQEVDGWYFHGSLDGVQTIAPSKHKIAAPTPTRVVVVETGGRPLPVVPPLAPSHPAGAAAASSYHAGSPVAPLHRPNLPPTPIPMAMNPAGVRPSLSSLGSGMPVFMPIPVVVTPSGNFALRSPHHPGVTRVAVRPPVTAEERLLPMLKAHQPGTPRWLRVAYDNHWMSFDVPPTVVRGIPAMPFRALFERAGGMVEWHASTQTVTAEKPGRSVELKIGSRKALVNHQVVQMILPAFIKRGRTMIPIGFVRQAMDINIQYNRATGEVILTSKHVLAMMMR